MKDWFTIEKIDETTFAISEYQHWEETHCYLVIGQEKALLIDTGLGITDIGVVTKQLTRLPVVTAATHVHWDHIGGHRHFSEFMVHEAEKSWISEQFPVPLAVVKENLLKEACEFPDDFFIENYQIFQGQPSVILTDGDIINLGKRKLQVIHTPGHSPGHMCFYDLERKYLFSGDLIYEGCLYAFYPTTNPEDFRDSVKKIKKLEVGKILPGHHRLDIPVKILDEIDAGFQQIFEEGKLKQGNGIFSFENFSIQI